MTGLEVMPMMKIYRPGEMNQDNFRGPVNGTIMKLYMAPYDRENII